MRQSAVHMISPAEPTSPAGPAARPDPVRAARLRAVAFVVGSAGTFALAAAAVKALGGSVPLPEAVLFRNLFALPPLLFLAAWTVPGGLRAALRTRHPRLHLERLFSGLAGMFGSFYGYVHLPLATVTALNFTMPLFLTALSVLVLGEKVDRRRLAVVVAGFVGVLIMLRPGGEGLHLGAALAVLGAAFGWALAMLSIRRMGQSGESGTTIVLWFTIGAAVVSGALSVPVWVWPGPTGWFWLAVTGIVSVAAQLMMTAAYRSADSTLLAPFEYTAILWTTAMGVLLWDEVPDLWDLVGFAVLVSAGLAMWRLELRKGPGA
ncbi:DMT family transporter [Muricoccus radiodurans]|uniref:DMT family transporter n=1 Tax=Muricoccus radiodurans TaxID=2231721 RepID=UPI003CF5769C